MTSGKFLPPDGDPEEFFQLQTQFRDRFKPFDEAEDTLVERMVAAEFKMRSVRYMDAGIFHYELKTNPMPQQFSEDERTNPLAWAFQCDSAHNNSFTKLIRYEGFLQREFSRSLRDLFKMQDERRARQAKPPKLNPSPQPPTPSPASKARPHGQPKNRKNESNPISRAPQHPRRRLGADAPQDPTPNPSPTKAKAPQSDNVTPKSPPT
jgi:hypothetical protein